MPLIRSDDEVIGAGGSIARYVEEGKDVIVVIFSFGEASDPIIKGKHLIKVRREEAKKVGEFLGVKQIIFLGIEDGKISKKVNNQGVIDSITSIVMKYKPKKIFTHSLIDTHSDHRSVYKIVIKGLKRVKYKYDLYTFDVWNFLHFFRKNQPKLYVDITDTFDKKMKALEMFESQRSYILTLKPSILLNARTNGMANKCKYAEKFVRIN